MRLLFDVPVKCGKKKKEAKLYEMDRYKAEKADTTSKYQSIVLKDLIESYAAVDFLIFF